MKSSNLIQYSFGFISKIIPQAIFLLTSMVLARYLTPDEFGQVSVLTIFVAIATTLNDSGLGGSLINQHNISNIDKEVVFTYNICLSILLYLIIYLFSPSIEKYYNSPGLANVARSLCIIFVFDSIGMVPKTILYRELKFEIIARIAIISAFSAAVCSILVACVLKNVYALVLYYIINSLFASLFFLWISKFKIHIKFRISILAKLLPFGIYTTLSNIIDACYESSLTIIIGKYMNMSQAGLLSQAKKLEDASSQSLGQTINTVAFPILSRIDSINIFKVECEKIIRSISLVIIPLLLTISILSNEIIIFLYGKTWIGSGYYLSILMIAGIFIIIEIIYRNFIKSLGKVKRLFKFTLFKRIIALLIIILSVIIFPSPYIVYAYVSGCLIGMLFNIKLFSKIINVNFFIEIINLLKFIIPAIIYYSLGQVINIYTEYGIIIKLIYCGLSISILMFIIYPLIYNFSILGYLKEIRNG